MNISFKLHFGGKAIAEWSVERNTSRTKPPSQLVLIPKEILQRDELKPYFRRATVVSHAETKRGFCVQLEAIRMPD